MNHDNCEKCNALKLLHDCNLCTECCYCDKFIFIVNGYRVVGKAFQVDNVPLLNLTVLLQYLDSAENTNILIQTNVNSFIVSSDKIDSIGWRTKHVEK